MDKKDTPVKRTIGFVDRILLAFGLIFLIWCFVFAFSYFRNSSNNDIPQDDDISVTELSVPIVVPVYIMPTAERAAPTPVAPKATILRQDAMLAKSPEELTAMLYLCRSSGLDLASEGFMSGGQLVTPDWAGSIGATASIYGGDALDSITERVAKFKTEDQFSLNTRFVVFGLTDSFSGVQRTYKRTKCKFYSDFSVEISSCHLPGNYSCSYRKLN